mmetsp:Transcript_132430/g.423913  ORF Transcript_132430/g.423913 Transcript_132430/m.423913 type:complete len:238 (+) Transcript_132430:1077-1790(+)
MTPTPRPSPSPPSSALPPPRAAPTPARAQALFLLPLGPRCRRRAALSRLRDLDASWTPLPSVPLLLQPRLASCRPPRIPSLCRPRQGPRASRRRWYPSGRRHQGPHCRLAKGRQSSGTRCMWATSPRCPPTSRAASATAACVTPRSTRCCGTPSRSAICRSPSSCWTCSRRALRTASMPVRSTTVAATPCCTFSVSCDPSAPRPPSSSKASLARCRPCCSRRPTKPAAPSCIMRLHR